MSNGWVLGWSCARPWPCRGRFGLDGSGAHAIRDLGWYTRKWKGPMETRVDMVFIRSFNPNWRPVLVFFSVVWHSFRVQPCSRQWKGCTRQHGIFREAATNTCPAASTEQIPSVSLTTRVVPVVLGIRRPTIDARKRVPRSGEPPNTERPRSARGLEEWLESKNGWSLFFLRQGGTRTYPSFIFVLWSLFGLSQ